MRAGANEPATFVGGQACSGCHAAEAERWKGSHHALAMQKATEATVLGDFADTQLEHFGVTTTFFREGDRPPISSKPERLIVGNRRFSARYRLNSARELSPPEEWPPRLPPAVSPRFSQLMW
jgi:hypothetical protein